MRGGIPPAVVISETFFYLRSVDPGDGVNQLQPYISIEGETLVAEWDNRQFPKNRSALVLLSLFWCVWAPVTVLMSYNFVSALGEERQAGDWFGLSAMVIWLVVAWPFVFLIPVRLLGYWAIERLEIDNQHFRHQFVNLPWLGAVDWAAAEIDQITYGRRGREAMPTIRVRRGWRQNLVAYWTPAEFRWQLYNAVSDHLRRIDSPIRVSP